jgi:MFS family permease
MLTRLLEKSQVFFAVFTLLAAFITYASMYGIRMPYKAATFEGYILWGTSYKTILIISQVMGYALSKFIGIKVISEMKKNNGRIKAIFIFTGIGLVALFLFGITPYPFNFIWLFFNGLPLGLVFGLVFSFLEGRRTTEILTVGLASSQIVSSGYAKSVGKWMILDFQVSEFWMPFLTGCLFYISLGLGAWMLSKIPSPSENDIKNRTERVPMDALQRKKFFSRFAFGLVMLISIYVVLTILRDFRDGFNVEIWNALGFHGAGIHTSAEVPVAFCVLFIIGAVMFIKRNSLALWMIHGFIMLGGVISIVSTLMYTQGMIGPFFWMASVGFGLFIGYSMYTTILFERLIATFRLKSNAGYIMYLADTMGYVGSVGIMLYREFGQKSMGYLHFFIQSTYVAGGLVFICAVASLLYFRKTYKKMV